MAVDVVSDTMKYYRKDMLLSIGAADIDMSYGRVYWGCNGV